MKKILAFVAIIAIATQLFSFSGAHAAGGYEMVDGKIKRISRKHAPEPSYYPLTKRQVAEKIAAGEIKPINRNSYPNTVGSRLAADTNAEFLSESFKRTLPETTESKGTENPYSIDDFEEQEEENTENPSPALEEDTKQNDADKLDDEFEKIFEDLFSEVKKQAKLKIIKIDGNTLFTIKDDTEYNDKLVEIYETSTAGLQTEKNKKSIIHELNKNSLKYRLLQNGKITPRQYGLGLKKTEFILKRYLKEEYIASTSNTL